MGYPKGCSLDPGHPATCSAKECDFPSCEEKGLEQPDIPIIEDVTLPIPTDSDFLKRFRRICDDCKRFELGTLKFEFGLCRLVDDNQGYRINAVVNNKPRWFVEFRPEDASDLPAMYTHLLDIIDLSLDTQYKNKN